MLPCRPFLMFQSMFLPSSKPSNGVLSHLGVKSQFPHNLCPVHLFSLVSSWHPSKPLSHHQTSQFFLLRDLAHASSTSSLCYPSRPSGLCIKGIFLHAEDGCPPTPYTFILPHGTHYHPTISSFLCLRTISPVECPLHGGMDFLCCDYC